MMELTARVLESEVLQHLGMHDTDHTHSALLVNNVCSAKRTEESRICSNYKKKEKEMAVNKPGSDC